MKQFKCCCFKQTSLFIIGIIFIVNNGEAKTPKNIIIMISDGCGYSHIDAASIYEFGETGIQIYQQFPVKYGMSTYSVNGHGYDPNSAWTDFNYVTKRPTDSAASATAMATGVKTYNVAVGVDVNKKPLENMIELLEKWSKATGVVTSVQFSDATPAAFTVHNKNRQNCVNIAKAMILNSQLEVIMGAGHPYFDEDGRPVSKSSFEYIGREVWTALKNGTAGSDADDDGILDPWTFIEDRTDFQRLMSGSTPKRVIGIPKVANTLQQERGGEKNADPFVIPFIETVPTLEEMTKAALNILDNDPDGFFVMIEGGAIDRASHANQSGRMIEEETAFNQAVRAAVKWVEKYSNWDETLVIVTGDHETGYLMGPKSGTQDNGKPIWNPIENQGKGILPGMEWHSGGHTNSLIPFFAKGAGSELFHDYANEIDYTRGKYLDNAEVGKVLFLMAENKGKHYK